MKHRILARYPLGNPRRTWRQDNFVLSNFSARGDDMRAVVRNLKEAGFNLLELGWATPKEAEEAVIFCEEEGIDLIYQDMTQFGGMGSRRFYGEKNRLEGVISAHKAWKHVVGYYIWDEPHMDGDIEEARELMDVCQRQAPDKLAFTVAIPSYNNAFTWENGQFPAYLERYLTRIDPVVASLDYYPIGEVSECHDGVTQIDNSNMWCDLALLKKLGEEHQMPIWFYYQGQDLHGTGQLTFPMVRMMMYAAALYGVKGLQHYEARGAVITQAGERDIFFADQRAIHREFRMLGGTLMALTCRHVFHDKSVTGKDGAAYAALAEDARESAYLGGELPRRVSVSELADDYGNGYMMVLNRDYAVTQTVRVPLNGNYRIYEVSKEDGAQRVVCESTDTLTVDLIPGDGALFRLQHAEQEAFTVEYRLTK